MLIVTSCLFVWALVSVCIPMVRLIKTSKNPYHVLPAAALLAALAGSFVHGLFDFELRIFPNALMLSILAGCAVAPLLRVESGKQEKLDGHEKHETPQKVGWGDRGTFAGGVRETREA